MPALIVDRYDDYLVLQTLNQGMDAAKDADRLVPRRDLSPARRSWRATTLPFAPRNNCRSNPQSSQGEAPECVSVQMNGLTLRADLLHGQKTGIFLDQRENYRAAARYASGGRALDCFTSTGGFALHLAAKCESVEAVDSSASALGHRACQRRS